MQQSAINGSEMEIFHSILKYRVENFLNLPNSTNDFSPFYYNDDAQWRDLYLKSKSKNVYLSKWHRDYINAKVYEKIQDTLNISDEDVETILLLLRRVGYFFQIISTDAKDKCIFYYFLQCNNLANSTEYFVDSKFRTYLLRRFLYSICVYAEDYTKFYVNKDDLFFLTSTNEKYNFINLVDTILGIVASEYSNEAAMLRNLKGIYHSFINSLVNQSFHFMQHSFYGLEQSACHLDIFLKSCNNITEVYDLLITTSLQSNPSSAENLVSDFIYMNYLTSIKDNPSDIDNLKSFIKDDFMFRKILNSLFDLDYFHYLQEVKAVYEVI